jgi:hypothetical protein
MKLLLILFSFFGVYCLQAQSMAKHFIVIGIDGMSPDGIRQANTPEIDKLIRDGASTMYARAVLSTSSSQNWASMVMGAGPEQHGITSNGWERNEAPFPPVVAGPEGIFPTIFCELRKQNPDAEIGIIYDWDGFGRLCEKTCINYVVDADGEDKTTTIAEAYIKKSKPNYLFIHIDNVDDAGHGSGHGSKAYYKAVEKADSLIGRIIQALADAKILEESVILVTADHGGKGHGHGGESLEELEIPFILYGKNVKKGKEIKHPVYQYDNAATAVFVLGITPPYAWIGRPVKSAFVGFDDPIGSVMPRRLAKPLIYPLAEGDAPAGGLFIGTFPFCKMVAEKDLAIRYTTDGSLPTRNAALYTDSFRVQKSTVIKARAFAKVDTSSSEVQTAYFRVLNADALPNIEYTYYELDTISEPQQLPIFEQLKEKKRGELYEFSVGMAIPREKNIAVQYNAKLLINAKGKYRFYATSDDGSKLLIDGKLVVDNDGNHGNRERSNTVELTQGVHTILVQYYNGGGGKWLEVYWSGDGLPKQILIPNSSR